MYAPLNEIVDAIGLAAAMKLVEHFGGTRLWLPLPENVTPDHEVSRIVGLDQARALARLWGQERPTIPRARFHLREMMKAEVHRDRDALTVPEMARKYGTTERHIYRLLAEECKADIARNAARQPSLF